MSEQRTQSASITGHAVEDFSYSPLDPARYAAELVGSDRKPVYKEGGFFVFRGLRPGKYTLRLSGEEFQTAEFPFTVPFAQRSLEAPGDDELAVVVKAVDAGAKKINFDPVILSRGVKAGARVIATGFKGTLAAALEPGKTMSARLNDVAALAPGKLVRIIRQPSVRMRFGPYAQMPAPLTRFVGRVSEAAAPAHGLAGATIRVLKINNVNVVLNDVGDAKIATVELGGTPVVLGAARDVTAPTNAKGDYNLYFDQPLITSVTLRAQLTGYATATKTVAVTPLARHRVDFLLNKS